VVVGELVTCRVVVPSRKSDDFSMRIVEVGLPPGAEVDRASLERALTANSSLGSYDVLPDRVVFYVWSCWWNSSPRRALACDFRFSCRLVFAARPLLRAYGTTRPDDR